jgi:hypothetical protein
LVLLVRVKQYPKRSERIADLTIEKRMKAGVIEAEASLRVLAPVKHPNASKHAPPRSEDAQMTGRGASLRIASPSRIQPMLDNIEAQRMARMPARNLSCFTYSPSHC